jgi:major histocompatibility complex class I
MKSTLLSYTYAVCKYRKTDFKKEEKPGVVAHAFNPSTREAEAGGFLSSRPAWSTK